MMKASPNNIKIGIVDLNEIGGRKTFIDNFYKCLKENNYNVSLVDIKKTTIKELDTFDILHFSSLSSASKVLFIKKKVKKIITIHGWVKEEIIGMMVGKKILDKVYLSIMLIFWKIVHHAIPLFFDAIVYPTEDTAVKIGLSGTVISNGIFINEYNDIKSKDLRKSTAEIIFISYSSPGGLKEAAISKTIDVVNDLNKILVAEKKVILFVFGNVSKETIGNDNVRYMGYRKDFLEIMKTADIFITAKDFPDLGYVEIEAGILGIPIAKFITGEEEIEDNMTGILAVNKQEMVEKLYNYIRDLEHSKKILGQHLRDYIIKNKSWDVLIGEWRKLFNELLE